jgi:excisionase family DNA binding protein
VADAPAPVWITAKEAATYARVGLKLIYREVDAGRLRAARVGGRRSIRLKAEWISAWLEASAPQPFAGPYRITAARQKDR